jgi:hypothetical protein
MKNAKKKNWEEEWYRSELKKVRTALIDLNCN